MAFWVTYDHLGKLVLASAIWSFVSLTPVLLGASIALSGGSLATVGAAGLLTVLGLGVLGPAMGAGLASLVKQLIDSRDGELKTMFAGARTFGGRAITLSAGYFGATVCLITSVWFYAHRLGPSWAWLGYALSAAAVWALAFAALTALYAGPALLHKGGRAGVTLRLAAALVLDNPGMTLGLAVNVVAAVVIAFILTPLVAFLLPAWLVALRMSAYEMMARRYAASDLAQGLRESTEARRLRYEREDAEDDYLNRGLRDALFPWKG